MSTGRPAVPFRPEKADEPASPCISVCRLQPGTDLCEGCWRTLAELSEWASAGVDRRRAILAAVAARRADRDAQEKTSAPLRRPSSPSSS